MAAGGATTSQCSRLAAAAAATSTTKTNMPATAPTTAAIATNRQVDRKQMKPRRHSPAAALLSVACLLCISSLKLSSSFPSGAPESACKDLKPGHGVEAQSGAAPFELTQDKLQVEQAGDQIKVTLSSPSKTNFRGLIVQALNEKGEPKGKFLPGKGLKTLDSCSAVTHSDREVKKTATLVWEAPAELKSKEAFMFRASVVVKMEEFYTGIKSTLASGSG